MSFHKSESGRCVFCGEPEHPAIPTDPDGWLAGFPLRPCPNVPEDHIYIDSEFKRGPRGQLVRVVARGGLMPRDIPDTRGTIERWADEDMAELEREWRDGRWHLT